MPPLSARPPENHGRSGAGAEKGAGGCAPGAAEAARPPSRVRSCPPGRGALGPGGHPLVPRGVRAESRRGPCRGIRPARSGGQGAHPPDGTDTPAQVLSSSPPPPPHGARGSFPRSPDCVEASLCDFSAVVRSGVRRGGDAAAAPEARRRGGAEAAQPHARRGALGPRSAPLTAWARVTTLLVRLQ